MSKIREITERAWQRLKGADSSVLNAAAGARGYSMAEVLATVGIIVILCAIVVVNVVSFQANLRQKELDAKAEIIYTAAQEQMTRIMASGWEGAFAAPERALVPGESSTTTVTAAEEGSTDDPTGGSEVDLSGINGSAYGTTPAGVSFIPADFALPGAMDENNPIEKWQICYISSAQLADTSSAAHLLFGDGGLDDELAGGNWVIEFDYKTLTVYSVYYSEGAYNCAGDNGYAANFASYNTTLRGWNGRLDSESVLGRGNHVGYHGGGSTGSDAEFKLAPQITVLNEEKLEVDISCSKPLISQDLEFLVTLSDDYGHSNTALYRIWSENSASSSSTGDYVYLRDGTAVTGKAGASFSNMGQRYTLKLVLDSLEGDGSLRFTNNYGSNMAQPASVLSEGEGDSDKLVEGSDIHIHVETRCPSNGLITPGTDEETTNSLYSDDVDTSQKPFVVTAHIKYGRHLQNLDASSGIGTSGSSRLSVVAAELDESIDFSSEDDLTGHYQGWASTYSGSYFNGTSTAGKPYFKPIANAALASFDGKNGDTVKRSISQLNIDIEKSENQGDGIAGLFAAAVGNLTIKNTVLTSASVAGIYSGGALLGYVGVGATAAIENCQVYLLVPEDTTGKTAADYLVFSRSFSGGLVGSSAGTLTIRSSSASTIVGGYYSGGLVGYNTNALTISGSYADCYLTGFQAGGLVGYASGGLIPTVENSYAAGFFANSTGTEGNSVAAGLVNGSADITRSYTLCGLLEGASFDEYLTTSRSENATAYYLDPGVVGQDEHGTETSSAGDLNNKFGDDTPFTMLERSYSKAYNLDNQGRGTYEWPTIAGLYHYGDWKIAGFQSGSLVYFEEYTITGNPNPVYGFEGGNVTRTLMDVGRDDANNKVTVVGDGYGVVYKQDEDPNVVVTVTNLSNSSQPLVGDVTITKDSTRYPVGEYYVYPLSAAISNTTNLNPGFFLNAQLEDKRTTPATSTYYRFNPHFARTVVQVNDPTEHAALGKNISIRTARQLFNLSLHYENYRTATQGCVFLQERNIAYTEYKWGTYVPKSQEAWGGGSLGAANVDKDRVCQQAPIGSGAGVHSFDAVYDGSCYEITDVSFLSYSGTYVGMFGYVSPNAVIRNVVLCTDYNPSSGENYRVQRDAHVATTATVSMGVLAGYNAGTIRNCAIAGYYLSGPEGTIHAYSNSSMNIGGLVGTNAGVIRNCAADTPKLRLSLLDSHTRAGGFVGYNTSEISNSYALGVIEVLSSKGGDSSMAGFAGGNDGAISNSYCATAVAVSGEGTGSYGFTPAGGVVYSCSFLNEGTYSYIGRMYSYNFNPDITYNYGTSTKYDALKVKASSSKAVKIENTFVHSQTNTSSGRYPYAGKVTNASGKYVHYGNWQDDVLLGTLGAFYWEKEEGSGNYGYHMTYLGSYEDSSAGASERRKVAGGSSLCTSHDDGGVITEYGYGFYVQKGQEGKVTAQWGDISCSSGSNVKLSSINGNCLNAAASQSLKEQMESTETGSDRKFAFYAFTTSTDPDAIDYIKLDGGSGANAEQNGTLKLNYIEGGADVEYDFTVSPFFANALSFDKIEGTAVASAEVSSSDGAVIDCTKEPGAPGESTAHKYEVRSLQQLQYINWNAASKSTNELVDAANYKNYPYLQYATNLNGSGNYSNAAKQDRSSAEAARSPREWLQTHDVAGDGSRIFAPIAGSATSSSYEYYDATLRTWFGGTYDGQSYTVKNVTVRSGSFYVGLFAVTAGAGIQNVIMYGTDGNAIVERDTTNNNSDGAYAIGSLVGVAFNYADESASTAKNVIKNCAVSGYSVIDSSANKETLGEVCIGGIIGVANVNLQRCSAVTDIVIQCTNLSQCAKWGNFIRVGGLVGGLRDSIENCYSGGTIRVSSYVLSATYDANGYQVLESSNSQASSASSTHVFLAGIAGSAFSSTFTNFNASQDGEMKIYNSYTYMQFPKMEGTIRSITMIGSVADRHSRGKKTTLENCHYLQSSASFGTNYPTYWFTNANKKLSQVLSTDDSVNKMLIGNADYLHDYLGESSSAIGYKNTNSVQAQTNATMAGAAFVSTLNTSSGGPWHGVSVIDASGMDIPGKFSFPANPGLEGKDYPYPAVVTQNDLTFGTAQSPETVYVHYGDWPFSGAHWVNGRDTMDIFTNMSNDGWAYKNFTLITTTNEEYELAKSLVNYESSIDGVAELVGLDKDDVNKTVTLTVKALNVGATVIKNNKISTAAFTLQVTANWELTAEAIEGSFSDTSNTVTIARPAGSTFSSATIKLHAKATEGDNEVTTSPHTEWNNPAPVSSEPSVLNDDLSVSGTGSNARTLKMTRVAAGTTLVTVTASYTYESGSVFTRQLFLNVTEPGVVGLSSTFNGASIFNETQVGTLDAVGENYTYPQAIRPSFDIEESDSNLFLYASLGEGILQEGEVQSITIKELGSGNSYECGDGIYSNSAPYFVSFGEDLASDDRFNYRGGTVSYTASDAPGEDLEVTVVFKRQLDGAGQVLFTLTTKVPASSVKQLEMVKLSYRVDASGSGGVNESSVPKGARVMLAQFADTGLSAPSGAAFQYWRDADDAKHEPGSVFVVSSDTAFTAAWGYELRLCMLDSNNANVDLFELTAVNGEGSLDSSYVKAAFEGRYYELLGWYAAADGSAVKILNADGTVVAENSAFTSSGKFSLAGPTVLYAKWKHSEKIWIPATSFEEGKFYLIASTHDLKSGKTDEAFLAYQENTRERTYGDVKRGTYLNKQAVTINGKDVKRTISGAVRENYISSDVNPVIDENYVWEAKSSDTDGYLELWNTKYTDAFLAENHSASVAGNVWPILAVGTGHLLDPNTDIIEKRKQFKWSNKELYCFQGGNKKVSFVTNTTDPIYVLGTNSNSSAARLYEYLTTLQDETFTCPLLEPSGNSLQTLSRAAGSDDPGSGGAPDALSFLKNIFTREED